MVIVFINEDLFISIILASSISDNLSATVLQLMFHLFTKSRMEIAT